MIPRTVAPAEEGAANRPSPPQPRRLRARALVLGALLIPPLQYWQLQLELRRYSFPTWAAPFYHVLFVLFVVALANLAVKRRRPQLALTGAELATVYVMLSVAGAIFAIDCMAVLVALMAHPTRFPSAANDLLPRWLVVQDADALKGYFLGSSTLYRAAHLRAWIGPLTAWSMCLLVLMAVLLGLSALFQRQWIERERLSYPIVQLPLGLAADTATFLRQPGLWLGFGVAAAITLVNGLHDWVPAVPVLPVKRQELSQYLVDPPWNAIGWTAWSMYPFAIGLSFFMPLELSFSIWVFFLLGKAQLVAAAALGLGKETQLPYLHQQAMGAYLAIFAVLLWMGRAHFRELSRAFHGGPATGETRVWRWILAGIGAGVLCLLAFAMAAGLSPLLALGFFALYFALSLMVARIRAELGFPVHDVDWSALHHTVVDVAGTRALSARSLAGLTLFYWTDRHFTGHPMPHQLEGFKMARSNGMLPGAMAVAVLIATVVAIVSGFWLYLDRYYALGAATAHWNGWTVKLGQEAFRALESGLRSPAAADPGAQAALSVGFGVALALSVLRLRLGVLPLHPLAYAVAPSWGMNNLWSCVFLAWLIKSCLLRYAALKGYRRAAPFFLGLVLGEFVCGAAWTLIGVLLGVPTYDFWP